MLFQEEHIDLIKEGKKVETRRDWKSKQAKEGAIHACQTEMLQPRHECDTFIEIEDVRKEKLGEMSPLDALNEGGYTLEEYKGEWEDINDEGWDPDKEVFVVSFRVDEADRTFRQKIIYFFEKMARVLLY